MMKKTKDFDNILEECLEQLLTGGKTVEQCLAEHPDDHDELEPLLRTALAAREAMDIGPSPEFRERARYQFQAAIREMEPQRRPGLFGWQPQWATALVVVLALLLASSGTVAAASDSMPDETLYQVKLATEAVRLRLTMSPLDKAELYVKLTDERVVEIIEMANQGKPERVQQAANRLNEQLVAIANLDLAEGDVIGETMVTLEAPAVAPEEPSLASAPEAALVPAPVPAPAAPPAEGAPRQMRSGQPKESLDAAAPEEETPALAAPRATGPPAGTGPGMAGVDGGEGAASGKQAKLRRDLSLRAMENQEALRQVLDKVPESARSALEQAIEVAGAGYEEAIRNLD